MKKIFITLFFSFVFVLCSNAALFKSGGSYLIRCFDRGSGAIVPGALNGQETPLYYSFQEPPSKDAYWTFTRTDKGGYLLQNAETGQYITYDGVYENNRRYVCLTNEVMGDSSRWTIEEYNGLYSIRNCFATSHFMHVRSSNVVGTYAQSGGTSANDLMQFFDRNGEVVELAGSGNITLPNCFQSFTVSGGQPVYDKLYNTFLMTLPRSLSGSDSFELEVGYQCADTAFEVYIDGSLVDSGEVFTFRPIEGEQSHELMVYSDSVVASGSLSFTFLPVVELKAFSGLSTKYCNGSAKVHEVDNMEGDSLFSVMLRYRGASASGWSKKSFAVKLVDANGVSIDRSFLGLRSDNNWILDGMAIDHARSRNRVATDLWNGYATKPYYFEKEPKALTGTRGSMVEVLLNGSYLGLYCMTEKLDRKQLKLKKYIEDATGMGNDTIRGCLYKSFSWGYTAWMGFDSSTRSYPRRVPSAYSNYSDTWAEWELKYPDYEDGEKIDWKPLHDAISLVAAADDDKFMAQVDSFFDMPVIRDYYLLMELIFGLDGNGKNLYFFTYNMQKYAKLSLAPWDMDGTWGRFWNGNFEPCNDPTVDLATFLRNNKGEHALYHRLFIQDYDRWSTALAERYAEIRPRFFNPDSLVKRFVDYHELSRASGAETREIKRWSGYNGINLDFEAEMDYLSGWIHSRIEALDKAYGYDPMAGVVDRVELEQFFSVAGSNSSIVVRTNGTLQLSVFSLYGTLLRTQQVERGMTVLDGFAPGIYIVNGKKVLVR